MTDMMTMARRSACLMVSRLPPGRWGHEDGLESAGHRTQVTGGRDDTGETVRVDGGRREREGEGGEERERERLGGGDWSQQVIGHR